MHITTASLRRQNAATVSLFSMSLSFDVEFSTPMSYSFERIDPSIRERNGSCGGRRETRWANWRMEPHSLLYLSKGK